MTTEFAASLHKHLGEMLHIAEDLGDDLVNVAPDLDESNSAYALITHCIGVTDWWIGKQIAGRDVVRDRDAEFQAAGTIDTLTAAVADIKSRLGKDLEGRDLDDRITDPDRYPDHDPARRWTKRAAVLHTLEELAQHHGHLDLTRDLLRRDPPA